MAGAGALSAQVKTMPDSLLLPTTYADCTVSHLPRRELMATAESSVQCCLHGGPTSTTSYSMRAILSVVLDTSHLSDSATAH
ncbi:hypothetical protein BDP67DRAFT_253798 [Colletotrichum lupini]|nr:hypothetical protein BDP67DRAFT_253798 [Colletotrichum lupini]